MQESMTTQLANTESPIIDLGTIINDHQAAASRKTSEIIIALRALIKEDGQNCTTEINTEVKSDGERTINNFAGDRSNLQEQGDRIHFCMRV